MKVERSLCTTACSPESFAPPQLWTFTWQRPCTREHWLDELPTSVLLTRLPDATRAELLAGVAAAIDATVRGIFTVRYTTVAVTAERTISERDWRHGATPRGSCRVYAYGPPSVWSQ
jgi:hypothetical protein